MRAELKARSIAALGAEERMEAATGSVAMCAGRLVERLHASRGTRPPQTRLSCMFSYAETGRSVSFQSKCSIFPLFTMIINLLQMARIGLRSSLKQNNQISEC